MEEEIVAEFNKSGFAQDEEEILKKCKPHFALSFLGNIFAVAGMICCDGEGRQNEKVHHAAKQLVASGPFTTADNFLFEPRTELPAYADRKLP
ncbi:hypothetical protein OIU77_011538 [Salix suchowensis]|uniref:Uncharacterized protein n=1 Tax=Salix suchowensis TaxID=1278906 RepID=A0ABQ9A0N0_9ROSI|nr:hypothetical protein OIU77_011538 [Salix suchowensis]